MTVRNYWPLKTVDDLWSLFLYNFSLCSKTFKFLGLEYAKILRLIPRPPLLISLSNNPMVLFHISLAFLCWMPCLHVLRESALKSGTAPYQTQLTCCRALVAMASSFRKKRLQHGCQKTLGHFNRFNKALYMQDMTFFILQNKWTIVGWFMLLVKGACLWLCLCPWTVREHIALTP